MKTHILSANSISKSYDGQTAVLKEIDLNIVKGEFVSIMGPSGSGKSTLLYLLSSLDKIDSGDVNLMGTELSTLKMNDLSDFRRKRIGFVFQNSTFLSNLTLLDNILLPAMGETNTTALRNRALDIMDKLGIKELAERNLQEVSGGQLQRAGIARALMNNPQILFADEPTGALNSKTADEILAIFLELNQAGMTIILVTHDATVASKGSRVLFLKDGNISKDVSFGDKEEAEKLHQIRIIMEELGI
ncbi:ABC transporter ATP-binding protein [Facklamia lactis]|uniref:ABC transporter ATP-binding protein n=1 Tax=Facklamia lactis TaxID=2749967 RepID=UPI0018CE9EC7|nr:ABC transporter ATP-binding protein [Facklamia lactis]MBG9980386.1 ABC transporter ATP-binding protein [Facklamia lactis]